jgi:hypothetical protein
MRKLFSVGPRLVASGTAPSNSDEKYELLIAKGELPSHTVANRRSILRPAHSSECVADADAGGAVAGTGIARVTGRVPRTIAIADAGIDCIHVGAL